MPLIGPFTTFLKPPLSKNFGNDAGRKLVGEPFIEPVPLVDEIAEIHAEQMKDGGMKIVNADTILDRLVPQVICRAQRHAAFDAASRHPDGKPTGIMIPTCRSGVVPHL